MQSVRALDSGPSAADSRRCACCPFGYHIDSSFVSFAHSITAGRPTDGGVVRSAIRRRARGGSVGAVTDRRRMPPPPPGTSTSNFSGLHRPVGPSASTGGGSVQDLIDELEGSLAGDGSPLSPLSPPARKPALDQEDTFATFGTTQRRLTVQQQQLDSMEETSMSASSDFSDRWPLRRGRRPHSASGRRDNSPISPPQRPTPLPLSQQQQQQLNEHEQQEDILLQRLQRPAPTIQFATSGVSTSSHWESRAANSCEAAVRTPPTKQAIVSSAVARTDASTVTIVFGGGGSGVDFGQTVFSSEDGSLDEPVTVLAAPPRRPVQQPTQPQTERLPAAIAMLPDIGWDEALLRRLEAEEAAIAAASVATEEQVTAARVEQLSESSGPAVADVSFAFMLPPEIRDFSQQVCTADGEQAALEELVVVAHATGSVQSSAGHQRSHIDKKVKVELPFIEVLDDPRVDLFSEDEDEGTTVDDRVEPLAIQPAQSAPNFAWMLPATGTQTEPDNSVTRVVSFLSVAIGTEKLDTDGAKLTQLADASVGTDSICQLDVSMETEPVAKSDFAFTTSPVAQSNVAIETEQQFYRDAAMETVAQKFVSVSMETDAAKVNSVSMATEAVGHSDVALETARLTQSSVSTEIETPIQHLTSSASTPAVLVVDATSECHPQLAAAAVQARPACQDAAVDFAAPVLSVATSDAWQQADRHLEVAPGVDECVGTDTTAAPQEDKQRNRRRSGGGRRHAGVTARPACRDVSLNFCSAPPERRSVGVDAAQSVQLADASVSTTEIAEDVDESAEAAEASLLSLTLLHRRQSVQTQIRQLRRSYGLGAGELAQLVGELLRRDVKSAGAQARPETVSASAATGSGLMVSRSVGGDDGDASVTQAGRSAEAGVQCRPAASNKFAFTERLHSFEAATNTSRPQLRDQFTSPERSLLVHSVACGPAWPLTVATDGDAVAGEDSPPTPPTPPQQRPPLPPTFPELRPLPSRQLSDLADYARTQMVTGAGNAHSPIRQFSAAEAAAASAGAGALSPSSPRSILKRGRAGAAELSQEAKKGVRFHSGVVGGSPSSSSADDDDDMDDEEEDYAGSPIEGSYFGADGRIELLYEHEDESAAASASASASSAFDEINEETADIEQDAVSISQPLMLQVPQDVEKACATFEAFRHDSTGVSAAELNDALSLIRRDWFRVSSVREASASQVKAYCDYFAGKSEHLLKKVLNMADDNGNTSLHYSVSHGRWSVVRVLLATGLADADRSNLSGYSAAMLTGLSQLTEEDAEGRDALRDLLRRSDVNRKATSAGQTALMLAASHGRLAILRLLLEAGADPNAQDDEGSTALMFAAEHGNLECARELLARPQTATELEDNEGSTALSIAMAGGHRDVALLIYARVNLANKGEDKLLFGSTTL